MNKDNDKEKDNGNWLSAQQAVLPDGTEIGNLPLINTILPPLSRRDTSSSAPAAITAIAATSDYPLT